MTDEALLSWIDRGQLIAALLVAIGVAGEFLLQFAARPISRRIAFARDMEISQQRERTANAERALAELQERARPRTIDPDVRAEIIESLQIGPHAPVEISFVSGSTTEPLEYARALREVLEAGGWTVTKSTGGPFMGVVPTGLIIMVPTDDFSLQDQASNLQIALRRGGIETRITSDARVKAADQRLLLIVGLKP